MLFPLGPGQPTAPNAGILRHEPGAHHPEHYHGFAQVWFILKGEFTIDGRLCPPGTMLYHPDPHFEGVFQRRDGDAEGNPPHQSAINERPEALSLECSDPQAAAWRAREPRPGSW
jgi:hypothetical protein